MNIRIYLHNFLIRTNIRMYSYRFFTQTNGRINIRLKNCTNIRIYSNIQTVLHSKTLTNEYPNIFVQSNLTRTNVRMYSYRKVDTNKYPNIFVSKN